MLLVFDIEIVIDFFCNFLGYKQISNNFGKESHNLR